MTAPSTVCPSCGEDVPFGRRTCEACGANLTAAEPHESATDDDQPTDEAAADAAAERAADVAAVGGADDAGWDIPAAAAPFEATPIEPAAERLDEPAPAPAWTPAPDAEAEPAPAPVPVEPPAAPFIPPVLREWNPGSPDPETGFAAELAVAEAESAGLAGSWLPPAATPPGALPEAPAMQYRPAEPPPAVGWAPPEGPADAAPATPSGAMPATLAAMLNRTSTGTPRWPGEDPVGADAGVTTSAEPAPLAPPSRMPDLGSAGAYAPPAAAAAPQAQRSLEPGKAPLFADLPFDAPNTLPGWLVAAGGAIATVSFLLPWVAVLDSYFTAWGLGSIANLPAFLVVFGTTALAILPSRLADWLRHGILGLAVGSFILGLTWYRLAGASGGQIGVILEGTGALLLLIGGILAIVRDRGADGPAERR